MHPAPCRSLVTKPVKSKAVKSIARLIAAVATVIALAGVARAQDCCADREASAALTSYLRENRLPLVGAEVYRSADGARRVVLYGFVASELGKTHAQGKALAFLANDSIAIDNRIAIRPEIRASGRRGRADMPNASSAAVGSQSFDQIMDDIEHYGVKSPPDEASLGSP
jgi:hypothetical protein